MMRCLAALLLCLLSSPALADSKVVMDLIGPADGPGTRSFLLTAHVTAARDGLLLVTQASDAASQVKQITIRAGNRTVLTCDPRLDNACIYLWPRASIPSALNNMQATMTTVSGASWAVPFQLVRP